MGEGLFADRDDAGDVGDGAGVDVSGGLMGASDADDFEFAGVGLFRDDGLNEFGADVECKDCMVGGGGFRFRSGGWCRANSLDGLFGLGGGDGFDFGE